jgi:hypothetical protein
MAKILYFDCFSGISGDMTLGALLDLGVDQNQLVRQLDSLGVTGYQLSVTRKQNNGITGTDFDVVLTAPHIDHHSHHHRNLADIEQLIEHSRIDQNAKLLAKKIFNTLGTSEAKIHNKPLSEIHFHEVGALDSIVDIVGAAICISLLKPDKIISSPLHLGSGTITCAHGVLPVPAPATADILAGIPVYSTGVKGELVTPTGAAIIKNIADEFGPLPSFIIEKTGYGTGKKQFDMPNLLRVFWGNDTSANDRLDSELLLLETNIDDMNPEIYTYLIPLLLEKGALDAYLTQILMKKGRPGILLSILCEPAQALILETIVFNETSTLGIRKTRLGRTSLHRKIITIQTEFGPIRVKAAYQNGALLKMAPEYEDCRKIAITSGLPLKQVYELALGRSQLV